ncbi:DUF4352 domain-containing protein [Nonomuraea sp. NPDC002799]
MAGPLPQERHPQPADGEPGQPPRKRSRALVMFGGGGVAVVLIAVAAFVAVRSDDPVAPVVGAAVRGAGIGVMAQDGDMAFTVMQLVWSDQVGTTVSGAEAQGRFLLVHVAVYNRGDRPVTYLAAQQKLNAGGRQYAASVKAAGYLKDSLTETVNPGGSVTVIVPFDLVGNVTPESIELHAQPGSTGVLVPFG